MIKKILIVFCILGFFSGIVYIKTTLASYEKRIASMLAVERIKANTIKIQKEADAIKAEGALRTKEWNEFEQKRAELRDKSLDSQRQTAIDDSWRERMESELRILRGQVSNPGMSQSSLHSSDEGLLVLQKKINDLQEKVNSLETSQRRLRSLNDELSSPRGRVDDIKGKMRYQK